jgi:hypothetical protein
LTQWYQHSDGDKGCVALLGIGLTLYEDANSSIFPVDKVDEILFDSMESGRKALEFDAI